MMSTATMNQVARRISFKEEIQIGHYSETQREKVATWNFMKTLEKTGKLTTEPLKSPLPEKSEVVDFIEFYKEQHACFENYQKKFDCELYDIIIQENKENNLIEALIGRMEELQALLPLYLEFYHISRFYEGKSFEWGDKGENMLASIFGRYTRLKSWREMEFMIKTIEDIWTKMDNSPEVEVGNVNHLDEVSVLNQMLVSPKRKLQQTEYFTGSLSPSEEEKERLKAGKTAINFKFGTRWDEIGFFLSRPTEAFNYLRRKTAEFYFAMFDKGIIVSLMNQLYDENEVPYAKRLADWNVPDAIKIEDPSRVVFNPIVCADRKFSCTNHATPDMTLFAEMDTIEKIKNNADEICRHICCRKHPGKLLLRLIRMDLTDMVTFCLDYGLTPASQSDDGNCMSVRWNTDTVPLTRKSRIENTRKYVEDGYSEHDLTRADERAAEYFATLKNSYEGESLTSSFSMVTPLSVAVQNCVYGNDLKILNILLDKDANPLFSSDIAIKSCVNGLNLLMQHRNAEMKEIPLLDSMVLTQKVDLLSKSPKEKRISPAEFEKEVGKVEPITKDVVPSQKTLKKRPSKKFSATASMFEQKKAEEKEPVKGASKRQSSSKLSWNPQSNNNNNSSKTKQTASMELIEHKKSIRSVRSKFQQNERKSLPLKKNEKKSEEPAKEIKVEEPIKEEKVEEQEPVQKAEEPQEEKEEPQEEKASRRSSGASTKSRAGRRGRLAAKKEKMKQLRLESGPKAVAAREDQRKKEVLDIDDDPNRPTTPVCTKELKSAMKQLVEKTRDLQKGEESKEQIARVRAKKCMEKVYDAVSAHKKLKERHFTKTLLYQACIEGRENAIRFLLERRGTDEKESLFGLIDSSMSTRRVLEDSKRLKFDADELELILPVIDSLMKDSLERKYPTFTITLTPILIMMKKYNLYFNHWRFLQLFRVMKLAMHDNLPGDRKVIYDMLQTEQMQHFLGLKDYNEFMKYRLERVQMDPKRKLKLRIESMEETYKKIKNLSCEAQALDTNSQPLDKLFRLATKIESLDLIMLLVDQGAMPSAKARFWMIATSIKAQNTAMFEYLFKNFQIDNLLTKAFVIALKGKFHQSMEKIFELGFSLKLDPVKPEKLNQRRGKGRRGGMVTVDANAKNRQTLNLFQRCVEDVLFERTIFDRDDGRRSKDNFTRQDEEATFYLLVDFLVKLPENNMQLIVDKIVARSAEEFNKRIWFYGFHKMFKLIVSNKKYALITDEFIDIYALNYAQWLFYIKDQKAKKEKDSAPRYKRRNFKRGNRGGAAQERRERLNSTASNASESAATLGNLDTEGFLSFAEPEVENDLKEIFRTANDHVEIAALKREVEVVKSHAENAEDTNRTPLELVPANSRRNGSRNYDYTQVVSMTNGESQDL